MHWHGLRLRNDMDGVPDVTGPAVAPGKTFTYSFIAPDPGTYFFHSHVGLQLDRGLAGTLLIDAPDDPGEIDAEFVVVLDDWADGVDGLTPEAIYEDLTASGSGMMGSGTDVTYPHYLINGRLPTDPDVLTVDPGSRIRLRIINAAADTTFRCAVAGNRLTVTHKDGVPVAPTDASALVTSMGER